LKGTHKRKPRPDIPYYAWLDLDGCYFCKNTNGCGGCKVLKRIRAEQKEKIDRRNRNRAI